MVSFMQRDLEWGFIEKCNTNNLTVINGLTDSLKLGSPFPTQTKKDIIALFHGAT